MIFVMNFTNLGNLLYFHRYYFHWIPNLNINFLDSHLFQLAYSRILHWALILLIFKAFSFFNEHDVLISLAFYLLKILNHCLNTHFIIKLLFVNKIDFINILMQFLYFVRLLISVLFIMNLRFNFY